MNNKIKSIIKDAIYEGLDEMYGLNREADPYFFDPDGEKAQYHRQIEEDVECTLLCRYVKKNDEEVEMEKEFTVSVPMRLEHEYDKYYDTDWYYPIDMDRIDLIKYVIDNHMIPNKLGYFILEEPLDAIKITDTFPNITWN